MADVKVYVNMSKLDKLLGALPREIAYYLHDGVHYGIYQELGTSKMRARPFIRPAVEQAMRELPAAIQKSGLEGLDEAVRGIALMAKGIAVDIAPFQTGALRASIDVSKEEPA